MSLTDLSRSARQRLRELLPQNNLLPRLSYALRYARQRRRGTPPRQGFSVVIATYNRLAFLERAVAAVLENTSGPFELIVVDNASSDGTRAYCERLIAGTDAVRALHLTRNIGTNAYAYGFLHARFDHLVCMDDDVLALSRGWDSAMLKAYRDVPKVGFLALNVIQDRYTTGAKKDADQYQCANYGATTLELGPVGAWFAVTTRAIYDEVGGFIFHPYKPYILHDGKYIRRLAKRGYFPAILRERYAYHASGAAWSAAYGFRKHWIQKYERNYRSLVGEIDAVAVVDKPSFDYAQAAVRARDAEQRAEPDTGAGL